MIIHGRYRCCPDAPSLLTRHREALGESVATSRVQRAGGMTFISSGPWVADNFSVRSPRDERPDRVRLIR